MNRRGFLARVLSLFGAAAVAAKVEAKPVVVFATTLRLQDGRWQDVEFEDLRSGDYFWTSNDPHKQWQATGNPVKISRDNYKIDCVETRLQMGNASRAS